MSVYELAWLLVQKSKGANLIARNTIVLHPLRQTALKQN